MSALDGLWIACRGLRHSKHEIQVERQRAILSKGSSAVQHDTCYIIYAPAQQCNCSMENDTPLVLFVMMLRHVTHSTLPATGQLAAHIRQLVHSHIEED